MEQIDGHRVSLSRRVARGLAHELISYGQNHKMMSHFAFRLPGLQRTKGCSLPLHFETPKREMRKAPRSHFDISATGGLQRTKGFSSTAFRNPETERNAKNPETPQEPFRHFGYRDFKGQRVALPLHFETPKREMRKAPRSHFGISATGTSKDKGFLSSTAFRNPET
jgi:hypothetical protein